MGVQNLQIMLRVPPNTKTFSRQLRSELTEAETHLWQRLRARQIYGKKFRRQHPVGKYILDFACIEARLVIEVDGGQHNELQNQIINARHGLRCKDGRYYVFGITKYCRMLRECLRK
jgi:very-short-patch-repair endonuclease